jgi:type IV conjugative transfer system lipoprotein TraV
MKRLIVIVAILCLSGCAEKSRFDCPYGKGPTCASMDTIDKMIKSDGTSTQNKSSCTKYSCAQSKCSQSRTVKDVKSAMISFPVQTCSNPALRIPEKIMQLWIAPYEASSGIYYQQAYVNIIVKEASWQAPVLDDASTREQYNG